MKKKLEIDNSKYFGSNIITSQFELAKVGGPSFNRLVYYSIEPKSAAEPSVDNLPIKSEYLVFDF
jgi:hypothetical protein